MTAQTPRKPTEAELAILQVLWANGPSTVREVHQTLEADRGSGYTTILKLMQIMTDKGLVERDESTRPQVYRPARSRQATQRQMLGDLLDRVFSGSPGNMVLAALSAKPTTAEERERIRALLDELEQQGKKSS